MSEGGGGISTKIYMTGVTYRKIREKYIAEGHCGSEL